MKIYRKIFFILALASVLTHLSSLAAQVNTHPLPSCYTNSTYFSVDVSGTTVPVSKTFGVYEYAQYSFSGKTTITIIVSENISSYKISPLAYNINGIVSGKTLTFDLEQSRYLIIKINNLPDLIITADDLETDVPNSSGVGIFNIVSNYNADPTGLTKSTTAIQNAIDAANTAGGGIVYVPAGIYSSGNIVLKSNVSIYMESGAVIRGSLDPADYTIHYNKQSQGYGSWFIYTATNANNIKIYGRGTIDGNGHALRTSASNKLFNAILMPLQCSNFNVNGITFRDSGLWAVTVTRSNDVIFLNTKHFNENNTDYEDDAVDVQESQNVLFKHSIAVSEDDTYSTKTWKSSTDIAQNWPGSAEVIENVTFDDCVAWSRCATFKVGYGVWNNQNNVTFKNSISYASMRAIAINHKYATKPATNIVFENIDIEKFWPRSGNSSRWFEITMEIQGGVVNGVIVKNINVRQLGSSASKMKGYSATTLVQNVTFKDIYTLGSITPAKTLKEMNITDTLYVKNSQVINTETDISELVQNNNLVYPNPTTGHLSIKDIAINSMVQIFDFMGCLLIETHDSTIDISNYPNGIYLLKANNKTTKVIKT